LDLAIARGWLALHEKQLAFEFVNITLGADKPAWYVEKINPRGTVPTLEHEGKFIFESLIIAEYISDRFPEQGTPLMPKDAYQRAQIRFVIDEFSNVVGACYGLIKNQDRAKDQEVKEKITGGLKKVLKLLHATSEGPYFLGEQFSLADVAVLPFLDRFHTTLQHYRDFDVLLRDESGTERLSQWLAAAYKRDSFKKTVQTPEFYINAYTSYAGAPISSEPKLRPLA